MLWPFVAKRAKRSAQLSVVARAGNLNDRFVIHQKVGPGDAISYIDEATKQVAMVPFGCGILKVASSREAAAAPEFLGFDERRNVVFASGAAVYWRTWKFLYTRLYQDETCLPDNGPFAPGR